MTGILITFEGQDGAGKSTAARLLLSRLHAAGIPCLATREPSDGPIGRLIRSVLKGETAVSRDAMGPLFAADRIDHAATIINPALAAGQVVVCDRGVLSNLVYRVAESEGPLFRCSYCFWRGDDWADGDCPKCELAGAMGLSEAAKGRLTWARSLDAGLAPTPTLTIVLTVGSEVAAGRRAARGKAEGYEDSSTQQRVRALYRRASWLTGGRVEMVSGEGGEGEVGERVWGCVGPIMEGVGK